MKRILIVNGPNLNMLGIREPDIYGEKTYKDLCRMIEEYAKERKIKVDFVQSNHEGDLVDAIQDAYGKADGIVINPTGANLPIAADRARALLTDPRFV